jgi:hypothetical protein
MLRAMTDRLGLDALDGRGRPRLLLAAALLSLALWSAVGCGLLWLAGRLLQS